MRELEKKSWEKRQCSHEQSLNIQIREKSHWSRLKTSFCSSFIQFVIILWKETKARKPARNWWLPSWVRELNKKESYFDSVLDCWVSTKIRGWSIGKRSLEIDRFRGWNWTICNWSFLLEKKIWNPIGLSGLDVGCLVNNWTRINSWCNLL